MSWSLFGSLNAKARLGAGLNSSPYKLIVTGRVKLLVVENAVSDWCGGGNSGELKAQLVKWRRVRESELCGGLRRANSVVPATPSLQPSAERNHLRRGFYGIRSTAVRSEIWSGRLWRPRR